MSTDLTVVSYRPEPDEWAWAFGGQPAVRRVQPGTVLELFTEDCFGGRVQGVDDLPSQVCEFPYLNPVTGPFHVEGAEPGDTLAVHFVSIEPARDWAVSSTFPHFGALTATHTTAMLHPPLEERVWLYDVDRDRRTVTFSARRSDFTVELPLDPMHGTVGVAPGGFEARQTITPDAHGGNMDSPELRAGTTAYFGVNQPGCRGSTSTTASTPGCATPDGPTWRSARRLTERDGTINVHWGGRMKRVVVCADGTPAEDGSSSG